MGNMAREVMDEPLCSSPMLGTGAWQVAVDAPHPSRRYRPVCKDTCLICLASLLYEVSSRGTDTDRSHAAGCRYSVWTNGICPC